MFFELINTNILRARDVGLELVYKYGWLIDTIQIQYPNSVPVDAGHCGRFRHRTGPYCCLTGKNLRSNWVAKFLQLEKKEAPFSPSPGPQKGGCPASTARRMRAHTHTREQPGRTAGRKGSNARPETSCRDGNLVVTLHRQNARKVSGHHRQEMARQINAYIKKHQIMRVKTMGHKAQGTSAGWIWAEAKVSGRKGSCGHFGCATPADRGCWHGLPGSSRTRGDGPDRPPAHSLWGLPPEWPHGAGKQGPAHSPAMPRGRHRPCGPYSWPVHDGVASRGPSL